MKSSSSADRRDELTKFEFKALDSRHYFPQFLWKLFLADMGPRWTHSHRIHVYDIYNDVLAEMRRIPQCKSIFCDFISDDLEEECLRIIKAAEDSFNALETSAEQAIISLLESLCTSNVDSDKIMQRRSVTLDAKSEHTLRKYLIFLRYRNSDQYHDTVARLGSKASPSYQWMRFIPKGPLRRRAVLRSIVAFLDHGLSVGPGGDGRSQGSSMKVKPGYFADIEDQCWKPLREGRTEISVGIASEAQEFITTDTWFGNLDEVDPDGFCDGSYHLFFPITPTVALYLITKPPQLRHPWGSGRFYVLPAQDNNLPNDDTRKRKREDTLIDADSASSSGDASSTHKRPRSEGIENDTEDLMDIDDDDDGLLTPNSSLSLDNETVAGMSSPVVSPPKFVELSCDIEAVPDVHLRNAILLRTSPDYILFSSLPSMITAITVTPSLSSSSTSDLEYPSDASLSKLKTRCREKHIREGLMKTLVVRGSVSVCDLTEEVKMIGDGPVEHGSFADIWQAEWEEKGPFGLGAGTKKVVALKVLRQCLPNDVKEKLLKRLKDEVLTWHRLHHRHIVQLHGIVQLPQTLAMVSPWCRNGTVVHYLRTINPEADRIKLMVQIASGVAYLHEFKPVVIHGDLKGNNILIDDTGAALITDFGVSSVLDPLPSSFSSSSSSIGLTESFFGGATRWMAPELIMALVEDEEGKKPELTKSSDVYAFASVCLEIMTGKLPYPDSTNPHAVTVAKIRGIKPSRGSQRTFYDSPSPSSGTSSYPLPPGASFSYSESRNSGSKYSIIEHDFWTMMDRCWDDWYSRPSMPELEVFFRGLVEARR